MTMVAMWILILVALLGLGGTAIVVTMIAVAVAKNRPGLAALALGLGFGALLVAGAAGFLFVGYSSRAEVVSTEYHVGPMHWQFDGPVDGPYEDRPTWAASGLRVLLIGAGLLAFAVMMVRQLRSDKCMGKHRIGWAPALILMIATVGMLGFVAMRWVYAPTRPRIVQGVEEAIGRTQRMADETQRHVASIQVVNGAAQMSIHELEDKYTAPRIPLSPPEAPTPPMVASASSAAAPVANEAVLPVALDESAEANDDASAADEPTEASDHEEGATDKAVEPAASAKSESDAENHDDVESDPITTDDQNETADDDHSAEAERTSDAASESQDTPPAREGAKPQAVSPANAALATSSAAKEMAARLASFAKAVNQVVDEYTRAAAAEASPPPQEIATIKPAAIGSATTEIRPHWVDQGPKKIGNIQRDIIVTDEYATEQECYKARDIYLLLTTYDHLARLVDLGNFSDGSRPNLTFHYDQVLADGQMLVANGHPHDVRLRQLASMGIGIDYVRREIGKEEYFETVERSVGPMKKLYTLVEFNDSVDRELERRWAAYRRHERFAVVGVGAASILGLLGGVWGLLKIDTATKGYYTKRLFLGVPLGILGAFGLLVLFMETIGGR